MSENITNSLVKRTKPADKPFEIRDAGLKGLLLRVQPTGTMTYYLEYKRGSRVKIGPADALSPEQAREIAKGVLAEHYRGEDPIEKRRKADTENYLTFLTDFYEAHLRATLRKGVDNSENVRETMANLTRLFPEFHKLALSEITPLLIDRWIHRRTDEGIKPTSIRRQLNDLRACLNYAAKRGALAESPFEKMDAYEAHDEERIRCLSPKEEEKLRRALDAREAKIKEARRSANQWRIERGQEPHIDLDSYEYADHLKPAVLLTLNTGLRLGELLKLRWKGGVDLDSGVLTVTAGTAKSAKARHIKLNAEAMHVLTEWKRQPAGTTGKANADGSVYVFCNEDGTPFKNVRTSWIGVVEDAKLVDFHWHDLRHTFASKLVIAGVDLYRVKTLLGHSDFKMTQRYAHLEPHHMQDAVDKLCAATR